MIVIFAENSAIIFSLIIFLVLIVGFIIVRIKEKGEEKFEKRKW